MMLLASVGVLLALGFAFTNGFQDAASTAATMVSSRSATPRQAIILISVMNALGAMIGGSAVAFTIAELVTGVDGTATVIIMFSALFGAIAWNVTTWYHGIPSSSTYGLVGGIIGAGVAVAGTGGISWGFTELTTSWQLVGAMKVFIYLLVSIAFGFIGGFLIFRLTRFLFRNAKRSVNLKLKRSQWIVTGIFALANGANDSQKQLGMIALILLSAGTTTALDIPIWARVAVALAIGAGTLTGGWRVMKTVGSKLFVVQPIHSIDSQAVSGAAILISTFQGAPISSTQVVSSSILGIGTADNPRKVNWPKARNVMSAWIITFPAAAAIAGVVAFILSQFL